MTFMDLYKVVSGECYILIECEGNAARSFELDAYHLDDIENWLEDGNGERLYESHESRSDGKEILDDIYFYYEIAEIYANRDTTCVRVVIPEREYNDLSNDIDAYYENND